MAQARTINLTINSDTRQLRRQLILTELVITRSFWRRIRLHISLWRLSREGFA